MKIKELSLIFLSIFLQEVALLAALEIFFFPSFVFFTLGVVLFLALALTNYKGLFFYGVIDARNKPYNAISKICFFVTIFICVSICLAGYIISGDTNRLLERVVVSSILSWYAHTVFFSSFFLGKGVAVFMHNPYAWLFGKETIK